ncbi:hypothetical protein ACIO02_23115 [Streptomyces sp. NPDC087568]|uniref:hypothetical protein n=1 Tax=Streptomyces sp. NPDC087568 TaxID=3365799 RepID=UPI00380D99ED
MPEAREALHGRDEQPREQALRGVLAVPGDVVVDDLVVVRGAGPPVEHLLAGQVLEDQLLVVVDVQGLRGRGGDGRTGRGQHGRDHRRGRDPALGLRGLPRPDLVPLVHLRPRPGRHVLVQLRGGGRPALSLRGFGHRGVDGGRDGAALVPAVFLPFRAARAVLAGVEQHAVVAPHVAALLSA